MTHGTAVVGTCLRLAPPAELRLAIVGTASQLPGLRQFRAHGSLAARLGRKPVGSPKRHSARELLVVSHSHMMVNLASLEFA
jgi:hypothetical protein